MSCSISIKINPENTLNELKQALSFFKPILPLTEAVFNFLVENDCYEITFVDNSTEYQGSIYETTASDGNTYRIIVSEQFNQGFKANRNNQN